jgi:hypothetical protein
MVIVYMSDRAGRSFWVSSSPYMQFILEDQHARVLHRGWVELELALKALLIPVVSRAVLTAGPVSVKQLSAGLSIFLLFILLMSLSNKNEESSTLVQILSQ